MKFVRPFFSDNNYRESSTKSQNEASFEEIGYAPLLDCNSDSDISEIESLSSFKYAAKKCRRSLN